MAKQFPLNTTVCLDALNRPLVRGDFVLMPSYGGFSLGVVKKPSSEKVQIKGALITMLLKDVTKNRTVPPNALYKIDQQEAISMLVQAKLNANVHVCPAGEQLLVQIKRQRDRERKNEGSVALLDG